MARVFSKHCFLAACLLFVFGVLGATTAPARAQLTTVTLVRFSGANGTYPMAALVQGSDGSFYGTTTDGGSSVGSGNNGLGYGTVFKVTSSGTLTTLANFTNTNGAYPVAALVQGSDGNFYGTTLMGGASGEGTIFQITPSGTLTTLYAFSALDGNFENSDGAQPSAPLLQGNDGSLYGTTRFGGANAGGTVFKITPSGSLTTLHTFSALDSHNDNSDGANSSAALILGSDGNFYGTAQLGGSSGFGTVFTMKPSGTLTAIYSFDYITPTGTEPVSALVEGPDGDFYGTTIQGGGGGSNGGAVYKITPSGTVTPLYSFGSAGPDGQSPQDALILGNDGNFYGTTLAGGSSSDGTIFKITPSGTESVLVNLTRTTGSGPFSSLVLGRDGNFYGTAQSGGYNNNGTVFGLFGPPTAQGASETTPENTSVTFTVAFNDPSGKGVTSIAYPTEPTHGTLSTGAIMETGTTGTVTITYTPVTSYVGGDSFTYTVSGYTGTSTPQAVTLSVNAVVPTITSFTPASGPVGTSVTITGTNLNGTTAVRFHNASAKTFSSNGAGTQLTVTVPTGAATGTITVTTPGGSVKTATAFSVTASAAPTITSVSPVSGPVGTSVTITGMNFTGATAVTFHGTTATAFTVVSATSITATVPSGATTGAITVTTPSGTATSPGSFTVTIPAPTITSFSPTSGRVGTVVTITGTNLSGATKVRFHNASAVTYSVNGSGTQITVTVPSGTGTGTITVTTPGGSVTSAQTYTLTH